MSHLSTSDALLLRIVAAGALTAVTLAATAQTTLNKLPPLGGSTPEFTLPPGGLTAVLSQPSGTRPINASQVQALAQAIAAANAEASAQVAKLRPVATAPIPPNCDRRIVAYGAFGAATTFTLRPGQHVVLQGCFGDAPPGEMRLLGVGNSGFTPLQVLEWKPNFVHAQVPNLQGVYDNDARLQLKFGDGDFSNELTGKFVATRAKYEISGPAIQSLTSLAVVGAMPAGSNVYSYSGNQVAHDFPVPSIFSGMATNGVMLVTPGNKLGSYEIRARAKQMQLQGYYASLLGGQSQFSHWGPGGELRLDWSTVTQGSPWGIHALRFDKLVVEAPVGTLPGAQPLPN